MARSSLRFASPVVFTVSPDEPGEAYARVRPDLDAVPAAAVGRITTNVTSAVATVFGALPTIDALGDDIEDLPHINHPLRRKLRDFTLALYHVGVIVMHAGAGKASLNVLMAEAMRLRARILSSAETLAVCELVDPAQVASIRAGSGQLDTANDLTALAQLFRSDGDALFSKVPVTRGEIDRAAELGLQLVAALGRRQVGSDGEGLPSRYEDDRARAFRLVVWSYNEARRAVSFLRWHEGDADLLVPSLFRSKRRRGPSKGEPSGGEPGEPGEDGPGEPGGEGAVANATGTS